jgi:DNA polymerase-4
MRWIAHIDMNAYFASIEEKVNPAIRGKPILVTGAPEGRSVVCTASYSARRYGISSGMSLKEALRLCPHAVVVTGNPARYTATLLKLVRILEGFTYLIEVASVDEVYMDVSGIVGDGGREEAKRLAGEIKRAVASGLDLPCSVGIASNKVLAKFASGLEKPLGEVVIAPEDVEKVLENLPVDGLPGIGLKTAIHLRGRRVCVVLRRGDLVSVVKHRTLKTATDDARKIYAEAFLLIRGIGIDDRGVRCWFTLYYD